LCGDYLGEDAKVVHSRLDGVGGRGDFELLLKALAGLQRDSILQAGIVFLSKEKHC